MYVSTSLLTVICATFVLADTHYLYSGFFSGNVITGIEFDDVAFTLTLSKNITTQDVGGSKWIAMDTNKDNLYVATTGMFQSYAIGSDMGLTLQSNVSLSSNCSNANFIVASSTLPFTVFGAPYSAGCSSLAISVDVAGAMQAAFANVTYDSSAGVHGLALSPDNDFIYSADDMGNGVWVHSYDLSTGSVEEVQHLNAPNGSDPRHLAVHPNGNWVYVVYEAANSIAVYSRDSSTGMLVDTSTTYSLLPSGYTNSSSYWADEALFSIPSSNRNSSAPKYLIASTRSRTTGTPGFVSVFALDATSGAITEQLFLLPTTDSGGSANAVAPASFSEDYFAIADSGSNFVEVWKIVDSGTGTTASAVAHLDLAVGPANVIWYS